MTPITSHDIEILSESVTGRTESVFAAAQAATTQTAREVYTGARVLVTGAAGFIGGQTLRLILDLEPSLVVLADTWENGLAERVRHLRSSGAVRPGTRIEPRLVDVTSPLMDRVVAEEGPFEIVLAFAAAKHVRSERDAASALHMLSVNVNGTFRVIAAAAKQNPACRLFMVSTDKAADPSSLMGASKRLMERAVYSRFPTATSTRFANVAFSNGSLLESWLIRLANGQVLPVPTQTSRFFVQPSEAGQLCLVSSLAPQGSIVVPAAGVVEDTLLEDALERVLQRLALRAEHVDDESKASPSVVPGVVTVLRTPRDTAGEKAAEVFVSANEQATRWLPALETISGTAENPDVGDTLAWITDACEGRSAPTLHEIMARVANAVPEFHHVDSIKRLDDRI
ncbi:polysaccharide biosynthesis protein [Xylanimonas allomyrinae]|uniref:polysaccharide biosynthesis protein n=1 Tax=Xylanimonas allomyrinae TaxID=2509459 RepID=UPI0013A61C65|nr:polysaccharide biosynthesis protein [Xylanimonas allomyrinae]